MVNPVYINQPIKGKDIQLSVQTGKSTDIRQALESRSKILGRARGYEFAGPSSFLGSSNKNRFSQPIYDLSEIARASDIEPYISQSIRKHREQILKEGFTVTGSDDELVKYINQRLFEISLVTGITTDQWVRELVTNLVTYHNAYLIFRRDKDRSSGKPYKLYGKLINPIAGVFVGDPTTMEVSVDKYGTPKKWRQVIDGIHDSDTKIEREYNVEDVVHITMDKKTGFTFGTPYLLPVLDDIRALRKLEEVAIVVSSKEAFPLYHYKVGTENRPAIYYEGGSNEVDQAHTAVAGLPSQGYIVTSERHEIALVSRQGSALDLSPYLAYFEARVVAGLRLSPLDLGRGGGFSRGTASNLNKSLQDAAQDYQQVISDCLSNFVILPLLLEGIYDIVPDNIVKFHFPTIDREEERAKQNQGLQLYLGNVITSAEFRKTYLNRQPLAESEKEDTNLHQQTQAQMQIASLKQQQTAQSNLGEKATTNKARNTAQPTNQSGTKQASSRFKANDYKLGVINNFRVSRASILSNIDTFKEDTSLDELIRDFIKQSAELSRGYITDYVEEGYVKAKKEYFTLYPDEDVDFDEIGNRALDRFFNNFVVKSFWKAISPYKDQLQVFLKGDLDDNIDPVRVLSCLDTIESSIKLLIIDQVVTAERFGFIKFAKKIGSKSIDLVNPDTQERVPLDISKLIYKTFIPTTTNISHFLSFSTSKE
jgi:hypothetical protein